jgi:hypothetical protein
MSLGAKSGLHVAATLALVCAGGAAHAETWSPKVGTELVEALALGEGGVIRVKVDTPIATAQCGTAQIFDFVFSEIPQEQRSVVISALYMAHAADRQIRLYVVDTECTSWGSPKFTGVDVFK